MALIPPRFQRNDFHCPFCGVYAHQTFLSVVVLVGKGSQGLDEAMVSVCSHCTKFSYWVKGQMVHPEASLAPLPNEDLADDIKNDYQEARAITQKSPRGAAALLRLCIQKLCVQLGLPGKDLNTDIAKLVKQGLNPKIQQSLDIVRVVGNHAVHPGEMDIRDDPDTASKLFDLVNLIARTMVSEPKEVEKFYNSLPKGAKAQVEKRDRTAP